ncbi:hypothetical protein J4231_01170 [Candidatus Woesearchaeota archaeon]|nr:hypothetical protein [Candidatus Woesearchaeota archaeon]
MDIGFNPLNEDEDPYPNNGAYQNEVYSRKKWYGFEEELAEFASRFNHRHFDQMHDAENSDETCDLCRKLGLVKEMGLVQVLH